MRHMGCVMLFLTLASISEGQPQDRRAGASVERQLEEAQRQRAVNQRLMLDTALDMAEALQGFATSQGGDSGTAANLVRLAELGREVKVAARNSDAMEAGKLVSEAGKIVALETAAKISDLAEASALADNATLPLFMNIVPAARMYGRFVLFSTKDARLVQREAELKNQGNLLIAKTPTRRARQSSVVPSNQQSDLPVQNDNVPELDNAVLLCKWLDIGNPVFSNDVEEDAFYRRFPALDQYRALAEYRSPAFEVKNWAGVRDDLRRRTLPAQSSVAPQPALLTDSLLTMSGTCSEEQQRTLENRHDQCIKACVQANGGLRSPRANDCIGACVRDRCPVEPWHPGNSSW